MKGTASAAEMRDLSRSPRLLSVNGATVRKQGTLPEIIDAVASRGIGGIAPWLDQLQATGAQEAAPRPGRISQHG